jgi:hypothetical protein
MMPDPTKSFRMSPELTEAVLSFAKERGQGFTEFVTETLEERLSGKVNNSSNSVSLASTDLSNFTETIKLERLSHSELRETIADLNRVYREVLDERNRNLSSSKEAAQGMEQAKEQLKSMVELGGFTTKKCEEAITQMGKSLSRVSDLLDGGVKKITGNILHLEKLSTSLEYISSKELKNFEIDMEKNRKHFSNMSEELREDFKNQAKDFNYRVANRWQWVAGILVVLFFLGAGGSLAWQYSYNKSEIEKLTKEKLSSSQDLLFFYQESCQGRPVSMEKSFCQKNDLMKNRYKDPYR